MRVRCDGESGIPSARERYRSACKGSFLGVSHAAWKVRRKAADALGGIGAAGGEASGAALAAALGDGVTRDDDDFVRQRRRLRTAEVLQPLSCELRSVCSVPGP